MAVDGGGGGAQRLGGVDLPGEDGVPRHDRRSPGAAHGAVQRHSPALLSQREDEPRCLVECAGEVCVGTGSVGQPHLDVVIGHHDLGGADPAQRHHRVHLRAGLCRAQVAEHDVRVVQVEHHQEEVAPWLRSAVRQPAWAG
ncbi:hypothetical protein ACFFSW_00985 [Saccharothrix longispora]|uniref:hypothetical protein n=1 Tax=Saccharothrix longispora TaxID=33920 RepID=UPI00286C6AA8|nr:hypothetical protein [Saccharothrix longispora]